MKTPLQLFPKSAGAEQVSVVATDSPKSFDEKALENRGQDGLRGQLFVS
jgi:hypothetical protein